MQLARGTEGVRQKVSLRRQILSSDSDRKNSERESERDVEAREFSVSNDFFVEIVYSA